MIISSDLKHNHLKDGREIFQPLGGVRVLVVDDDFDNCVLFSLYLEDVGVEVRTAQSVLEALELITQFQPNLLITPVLSLSENNN